MTITSHSKAGQDIFAHRLVPGGGTFLDIGSNHPTVINNTFALEQLGWGGLLLDNDEYCRQISTIRKAPFIFGDVTKTDWGTLLRDHDLSGEPIDYVSLDVDSATLAALANLLKYNVRFMVMTLEHDVYRFGDSPRNSMRKLLNESGYILTCGDVMDDGCKFEDWYCHPNVPGIDKFYGPEGRDWREILDIGD